MPAAFERRVDEFGLSVATAKVLASAGLETIGQLCQRTESDLLKIDGVGRAGLREVKELLADLGLSLRMRL